MSKKEGDPPILLVSAGFPKGRSWETKTKEEARGRLYRKKKEVSCVRAGEVTKRIVRRYDVPAIKGKRSGKTIGGEI